MLISRGLHALLWTLALAAPPRDPVLSSPPLRDSLDVRSRSENDASKPDALRLQQRSIPQRRKRRGNGARSEGGWNPTTLRARQDDRCSDSTFCPDGAGSFQCCGADFQCCVAEDGTGACCPIECEGDECPSRSIAVNEAAVPTVIFTTTVIRTVTIATSTLTEVFVSTISQTLTFADPGLQTQTNTVTITAASAARRRARQVETSVPETASLSDLPSSTEVEAQATAQAGIEVSASPSSVPTATQNTGQADVGAETEAEAEAVATATVTTTVELVTTVMGVRTITSTIFNTVFVTRTIAPRASTTVSVTTTVRESMGSLGSPLPGGLTPPQNDDLLPENPPVLPSGTPASSPTGTRLPPGVTDILPSGAPTDRNDPQPMRPDSTPTNDPFRPIDGSNLTADEIAGIAVGIIFSLLLLILAAFLIHRLVKKKQAADLVRSHHDLSMSSSSGSGSEPASGSIPVAAGSILSDSTRNRLLRPAPVAAALASDGSSAGSPRSGDVRIVIRPAPKRRTQSSGLLPSGQTSRVPSGSSPSGGGGGGGGMRSLWPRPPGYSGQTYSFFVEDSGTTSPLDAQQWSVASDHGSRSGSRSDDRRGGAGGGGGGGGGGVGGEYLSVGRALSPWNAI